jgi:hypothetical protein
LKGTAQQKQQALVSRETEVGGRMWDKGPDNGNWPKCKRTTTMMYITLTLLAGVISFMFVATAVSSVVNAVRENAAAREALSRNAAF